MRPLHQVNKAVLLRINETHILAGAVAKLMIVTMTTIKTVNMF